MTFFNDRLLMVKMCIYICANTLFIKKYIFLKKNFILNMDSEEELAAAVVVYILQKKPKRKKLKKRSTSVKYWLT